ncbi:MAG TPA: DinB family protein [Candidatus Dormibacteraeota bacterium]|nr:DinB family protein [Candidatus Dormibacteraeota bacterium]
MEEQELAELNRFNAWANRSLLAGVRQLAPEQLDERRGAMYETIRGVLVHLAQVERSYLRMIRSEPREQLDWELPLDDIERVLAATDEGLLAVARSWPSSPEQRVHIPWFGRDFSVPQCLRQVLTHSANHRADVNGWLPLFGVESTDQDYIDLALSEHP